MIKEMDLLMVDEIIAIEKSVLKMTLGKQFLLAELKNPFAYYICFLKSNQVVGYLGARIVDSRAEILNIAVKNDFQRQGIGSLLLNSLFQETTKRKVKSIVLEVRKSNLQAINFYIKHQFNFNHTKKNYYDSEDGLVYIRGEK